MTHQERLDAAKAYYNAITAERAELSSLRDRIAAHGGIDALERLAAWRAEAIAKIDTLPALTRATVKKLLGLEDDT